MPRGDSGAETICAVATAEGQGAIAIVRLSGARALELLGQVSGRRRFPARRLVAVTVREPESRAVIDRALACFMPGPRSYTGEDVVEVHGHGGRLNAERLLMLFVGLGARLARPGEFTERAFLSGRLDLTQAEAVAQIIWAQSDRALRNAHAALGGELRARKNELVGRLTEALGLLEARIDFEEDTGGEVERQEVLRGIESVRQDLGALARGYERGRRLSGISVGLVGRVNAGKSSLFNRLLGVTRALVAPEPGTTRDYLEADALWSGVRVTLVDMAGERETAEAGGLEAAGRELAAGVRSRCDALVRVVDVAALGAAEVFAEATGTKVERASPQIVALNKVDLLSPAGRERWARAGQDAARAKVVLTSARDGDGVDELRRVVIDELLPPGGEAETVVVAERRQWEVVTRARDAASAAHAAAEQGLPEEMVAEHLREAILELGTLTGQQCTEEVLQAVFRRFCVGK